MTNPGAAFNHLWVWEGDRWNELVFALLATITNVSDEKVRELTEKLSNLDLLDVTRLTEICSKGGRTGLSRLLSSYNNVDFGHAYAHQIMEELRDYGFSQQEAEQALVTICEAASSLQKSHDGKVQRYLRHYGELMLKEIRDHFQFTALDSDKVQLAFILWFQNVLNMPISLIDDNIKEFCRQYNLQPEQLIKAADELNVNLGLVDDLVKSLLDEKICSKEVKWSLVGIMIS